MDKNEYHYSKRNLMTNAELQLYHFMKNNIHFINSIEIIPKVRLGDILEIDEEHGGTEKDYWKVSSKHVDFLICKKYTFEIICVVELDDYTHDSEEAKNKDKFIMEALASVGIKTFRVTGKIDRINKNYIDKIDEKINNALAPKCPYCGKKMVQKKAKSNQHRFFGCKNYKNGCVYTIDIDPIGEELP